MGNRISIAFKQGNRTSVVLFSHWGGMDFYDEALDYTKKLKEEAREKGLGYPLYRMDPETVMVDFIRHITAIEKRIEKDLYLGVNENDGDNSDNGHFIINLDDK